MNGEEQGYIPAQGYNDTSDYGVQYYPQQSNDASLIIQTDPKHILDRIEHILRRDKLNEQGEWVKQAGIKPMINELGLNSIMVDAEGIINQNTIMSNLTAAEIARIILELGDILLTKMLMESDEWAVEDSDIETIIFTILNMSYIALKRGFMEGERRFLKTSVRSHETIRINPNQQENNPYGTGSQSKNSFWGKLFK